MDTRVYTTECPVATLAHETKILIGVHDHIDAEMVTATGERRCALKRAFDSIDNRLDHVEIRASHLRARSGIGMMFQIHQIRILVAIIASRVPGEAPEARANNEAAEAIYRMLYSIRDEIERLTGDSAEDACSDFYMDRKYNPLDAVEKALAGKGVER